LKDDPRLHDSRIIETSAVQPPAIVGNVKLESIEKEIAKARINTLQTTGGLPVGSDSSAIPPKSTKSQIVELENEIRRSSRDQSIGIESPRHSPKKRQRQSILAQENAKFFKTTLTGKKRNTEEATLAKLVAFQQKLRQNSTDEAVISEEDYEKPPCALHNVPGCASCTASVKSLSDDNAAIPADWMKHELKFEKDLSGKNLLDPATRRIDNVADLEVIDPRSRQQLGSGKLVAKAASREWNRK
jgi:hypothetical protein